MSNTTTTTTTTTEPWREEIRRDALRAGMTEEMADLIARNCGKAAQSGEAMRRARGVTATCAAYGAMRLSVDAFRAGLDSDRCGAMLREALPRRGGAQRLDAAGIVAARNAITMAGVYAHAYGSRGARA
jgi:hypothetical protein